MFLFSKAGKRVGGREIAVMLNVVMIYVVLISIRVVYCRARRRVVNVNGVLINVVDRGREITVIKFLMPAILVYVVLIGIGVVYFRTRRRVIKVIFCLVGDIEARVHFSPGIIRAGGKGWGGRCVHFSSGDRFLLGPCIDNGRGRRVGVIFLLICSVLDGLL